MAFCDGCGATVDAEHTRQRIARLELATRYRPIHIKTLLLGVAPPAHISDYFYSSEQQAAQFQKAGFYLTHAVECPLAETTDLREAVRRAIPTVLKRVQLSYKPESIVLFSPATAELIGPMQAAGLADRLVLHGGAAYAALLDVTQDKMTQTLRA